MSDLSALIPQIAGTIILFNPDVSVSENIVRIISQTDHLFIIDNSDKKADWLNGVVNGNEKVSYHGLGGNRGIGYALNLASRLAMKSNYRFLLTMDQDSTPPPDLVSGILSRVPNLETLGLAGPLISPKESYQPKADIEEIDTLFTSGCIVNLMAWEAVGGYRDDFFIDHVDFEFCLHLLHKGYKNYRVNAVAMEHRLGNLKTKHLFGRPFFPSNHNAVRWYYMTRNRRIVRATYKESFPQYVHFDILSELKSLIKMIVFEKQKLLKLLMFFRGMRDFKKGITGVYTGP